MSFARGRFGVEYHPRNSPETPRLRGLFGLALALVAVAFIWYKVAHRRAEEPITPPPPPKNSEIQIPPPPAIPSYNVATSRSDAAKRPPDAVPRPVATLPPPQPSPTVAPAVRPLVARMEATRDQRPVQDQILIDRYAAAERQENLEIAADSLRKLCDRPTMADLRDPLLRRLGNINFQLLFSDKATPWTTTATVRRGDGRERIAHEYRNTPAIVAKLNPLVRWERLRPGNTVRVLRFPSAVLVIHRQTGCADLTLRKEEKFFRRYYFKTSSAAPSAVYEISGEAKATVAARFRELGVRVDPETRRELEMFLAPGSRITVTD